MAAEVSSLVRVINGYKDDRTVGNESPGTKSTALITRDLLGGTDATVGSLKNESQELDLDLQVPTGWEKRLDLKSGKVYLQRSNSSNLPSSEYRHQNLTNQTVAKLQDLNFPPSPPAKPLLNLFDDGSLELKLVSSSSSSSSSTNYQSVCTLDKVKSALERAEKEPIKRRSPHGKSSMSPSYSSSSSSIREAQEDHENDEKLLALPVAVGCTGCLSYVLVMKNNPKCPRCNTIVQLPTTKKPRIDLNMSI